MMRFAAQAARFFESVEIVELHHPDKADAPERHRPAYRRAGRRRAPRGRARADAGRHDGRARRRPRRATSTACGCTRCGPAAWSRTRRCCSATPGETLTIRHDSYDRASFMPGVLLAVRQVASRPGLTVGLETPDGPLRAGTGR